MYYYDSHSVDRSICVGIRNRRRRNTCVRMRIRCRQWIRMRMIMSGRVITRMHVSNRISNRRGSRHSISMIDSTRPYIVVSIRIAHMRRMVIRCTSSRSFHRCY